MKKNFKYILFLIGIVTLLFSSCSLDVKHPAAISDDAFWRNDVDAAQFLNNVYTQLAPGNARLIWDSYTDNSYDQYWWEGNYELYQQDQLSGANASTSWSFEGIAAANTFLENVDVCNMDSELKERMKAEARTLRAIGYIDKALKFGKVPIMKTTLDISQKEIARNSVEEVKQFIYEELEAAADILPESYSGSGSHNEKTRLTKYAALAFLSRAALNFGDFQYAEEVSTKLMTGRFSLFSTNTLTEAQELEVKELENYIDFDALGIDRDTFFKGMFSYTSLWHKENTVVDNPECIFLKEYKDPEQINYRPFIYFRPGTMGGQASHTPTQSMVDAYWTADGKVPSTLPSNAQRAENYKKLLTDFETAKAATEITFVDFCKELNESGKIKDYKYIQEFRNRDSRMYVTILFPFKGWFETEYGTNFYYEWLPKSSDTSQTGYIFRKLVPLSRSSTNDRGDDSNYHVFRYAEILLIFAESRTQNVGYDAQVIAALNQIRSRAGMPNVPTSFSSKEEALEFIYAERRIELACEGARFDDMLRLPSSYWTKTIDNLPITTLEGGTRIIMKWSDRKKLLPFSQSSLDLNSLLDQNPGY